MDGDFLKRWTGFVAIADFDPGAGPSVTQEEGSMAILGPYSVSDATVRPLQPVAWVHSRQYSQTSSLMLMCFSTGRKPCSLAIALWLARSRRW